MPDKPVLRRDEWRDPRGSEARCLTCGPLGTEDGMVPPQAAARIAGDHARESGHVTRAFHTQVIEYKLRDEDRPAREIPGAQQRGGDSG